LFTREPTDKKYDKTTVSGGANNKQIKRKRHITKGPTSSKHPKHLNNPKKRKQELATTNKDPSNKGNL